MFHKKLEFNRNTGLFLNIHAVVAFAVDVRSQVVTVVVGHFQHEQDYDAGKMPIVNTQHEIQGRELKALSVPAIEAYITKMAETDEAYAYAKE